jgi:exodeoxyribonuclease VII large subunit
MTEPFPLSPGQLVYRVSDLVGDLRAVCAEAFGSVWVEGEVAAVFRSRAGHVYFELRDEDAVLRAVVFRRAGQRLDGMLVEGQLVRVAARVDVYPERGALQLIVSDVQPAGDGALRLAFERLKQRLAQEGLFDPAGRRALPAMPRRIGVVTSLGGAAIHDFIRALRRRGAGLDVVVADARVQGEEAAREVVRGIRDLSADPAIEVIVLLRGGGSLQDLFTFNREEVVRAVHACGTPVISAIGHEIDWVLTDLAADARAATPTAAADLVCPDCPELLRRTVQLAARLRARQQARLRELGHRVEALRRGLVHPQERLAVAERRLAAARAALPRSAARQIRDGQDRLAAVRARLMRAAAPIVPSRAGAVAAARERLSAALARRAATAAARLASAAGRLDALSPLAVLARGYSITRRARDGAIVRSRRDVARGDTVLVTLAEGAVRADIVETLDATTADAPAAPAHDAVQASDPRADRPPR